MDSTRSASSSYVFFSGNGFLDGLRVRLLCMISIISPEVFASQMAHHTPLKQIAWSFTLE